MTITTGEDVLIELDERGRVSLSRKLTDGRTRYQAQVDQTGVIVLTPVVVLTETEVALLRRPDLQALIEEGFQDRDRFVRRGGRPQRRPTT